MWLLPLLALAHSAASSAENPFNLEVIARTGQALDDGSRIRELGTWPSLNDSGVVAFTAKVERDATELEAVFVSDGETVQDRARLIDSFFYNDVAQITGLTRHFTFGESVQINNRGQVAWRAHSRDNLFTFVFRLGATRDDFRLVAKKYYPRIDNPPLEAKSPFSWLFPSVTLSNVRGGQSRVVFSGARTTSEHTYLSTPVDTESGQHDTEADFHFSGPAPPGGTVNLFPMVSDNAWTVTRMGTEPTLLLFSDETLSSAWFLAEPPDFVAIGEKPGVSDDGALVGFMGHHQEQGVGIFGEASHGPFKIAGISGDGNLDPGETWTDRNLNGNVDREEDAGILGNFSLLPRVGVNRSFTDSSDSYSVAYLATSTEVGGAPGRVGLYVTRVDTVDPASPAASGPTKVTEAGDVLEGVPGSIEHIGLYDPLNNNGQLAFWIRTGEAQAIVRATYKCLDRMQLSSSRVAVAADAVDQADLRLVVTNCRDRGVPDRRISLAAEPAEGVFMAPEESLTDDEGVIGFAVRSNRPGPVTFTTTDLDNPDLTESVTILFECELPEYGETRNFLVPGDSFRCPGGAPLRPAEDINGDGGLDTLLKDDWVDTDGERFQLWCMKTGAGFLFFGLLYVPPEGPPRLVGKCPFNDGFNFGGITLGGDDPGHVNDFVATVWVSSDRNAPYQDCRATGRPVDPDNREHRWYYRYDVCTDTLVASCYVRGASGFTIVRHHVVEHPGLFYDSIPPVFSPPDSPGAVPGGAGGGLPEESHMLAEYRERCDIDLDRDCDADDLALFRATVGHCEADATGIFPEADSDHDGCISSDEDRVLFGNPFSRGDVNVDGSYDVSDAVFTLLFLFAGNGDLDCPRSADANDDGILQVTDPIYSLEALFAAGPPPAPPYLACGFDLTPDSLGCDDYALCD